MFLKNLPPYRPLNKARLELPYALILTAAKHACLYLRPIPAANLCYDGHFAVSSSIYICVYFCKEIPPVIVQKGSYTTRFPDQNQPITFMHCTRA